MIFKDKVLLLPHSPFRTLSNRIIQDSYFNGYDIMGSHKSSKRTLKIFLFTLFIAKNDNNSIYVDKEVKTMMKVIHGIEGDANKF